MHSCENDSSSEFRFLTVYPTRVTGQYTALWSLRVTG